MSVATNVTKFDFPNLDFQDEHENVLKRCSSLSKVISVYRNVLIFVNKLKARVKAKDEQRFGNLRVFPDDHNFTDESINLLLFRDQKIILVKYLIILIII